MKTYFPLVDLLRFFAALSVVCFHYFSAKLVPTNFAEMYIKHGYMGVQLFFIISGFVIYFSLTKNIKEYSLGRFLRLYPMFWILCTITYIATLLLDREGALDFKYYLYNLIILNTGKTAFMIDGSYWTLTMEIVFYVMIGVYVYMFKIKNIEWFYFTWLGISLLSYYFSIDDAIFSKLMLVRYAPYFIVGGLAALIYSTHKESDIFVNARRHLMLGLAMLSPFYISVKLIENNNGSTNSFGIYGPENVIILLAIYMVVAFAIFFNASIYDKIPHKICLVLGGITYPLYLLHQKFGSLIINRLGGSGEYGNVSMISISVFIFIILLCYIISKYEAAIRRVMYKRIIKIL